MSDTQAKSGVPIKDENLDPYRERANGWLSRAKDIPPRGSSNAGSSPSTTLRLDSLAPEPRDVSVYDLGKQVSKDERLYSEGVQLCLTSIRRGIQIGSYLADLYTVASNLDNLIAENENRKSAMPPERRTELEGKVQTASVIAIFAAAYYAYKSIANYKPEQVRTFMEDLPWKPVFNYQSPRAAFNSFAFNLGLYLERAAGAQTELPFIATTLQFMKGVLDEIGLRKESLRYAEPFTGITYRLQGSEFSINGFEVRLGNEGTQVEFRKVEFTEIDGNQQAKNFAMRQLYRLLCYDLERKRNPFCDIGGLSSVVLGAGKPGTGKTLLASASVTTLMRLCEEIELPCACLPFPGTIISTFQGGSGERAAEWFNQFDDPSRINFGIIDDAENVVQNRTDQGVSAGVREVIGEILRRTEGATAIERGNKMLWLLTNIKEMIDPAILSRMTERFDIDGAQTEHDFLDQDKRWYSKFAGLDPSFVDLSDPNNYTYFSDQGIVQFGKTYEGYDYPKDERICAIVKEAENLLGKDARRQQRFYALVFKGVRERCPEYLFTSRDVRNIQSAVSVRIMDFDFPKEWFEKLDLFFKKGYDTKKVMLTDLMTQSMKGMKFSQVRYQEMIRYLDTLAGIRNAGFERLVGQRVEQLRVEDAALKRIRAS